MTETISRSPRFLKYLCIAAVVLFGLLLLFINSNLAALAEMILPGSALWTHAILLGIEALALLWFWRGLFRGPKHLLLMDKTSPEAQTAFARELVRRMRGNALIKAAGITQQGSGKDEEAAYLERCLALLREKADEEIRQNAKRIFLATALSQNGRLDALIVFVSLCRLVWRVSAIYNQRPHPGEITSLYWAVASTTFLAFSIEELDIATEITVGFGEAFHAMAPAGLTASIPFAGKALQTFTASTIDGASNCYLALRAGIITRNAYAYGACLEEKPSRAAVFREAGAQLLDMSQELVGKVAGAVAGGISATARNAACSAGEKTVQTGKDIVEGIGRVGQGISSTAEKLAYGTVNTAGRLASESVAGASRLASETVDGVDRLASGVADKAGRIASGTLGVVQSTGNGIARAGSYAVTTVNQATGKAASGARRLLRLPSRLTGKSENKKTALEKTHGKSEKKTAK